MPIRPVKFISMDGTIKQAQGVISNADVVTWNTSPDLSVLEGISTFITNLSTTSSLGGTVTYTIIGGTDNESFTIDNQNEFNFATSKDYESPSDYNGDNVYHVTIQATSSAGGFAIQAFNVTVNNIGPEWITSSGQVIVEERALELTLSAIWNQDSSPITEFSIVGGADQSLFSITGAGSNILNFTSGTPTFTAPEDADLNGVYEVTVRASKAPSAETSDRTFSITVLQLDEITIDFSVGANAYEPMEDTFAMYNSVYGATEDYVFNGSSYGILNVSAVENLTSSATVDISCNTGTIYISDINGLTVSNTHPNNTGRIIFEGAYSDINEALNSMTVSAAANSLIIEVDNGYDTVTKTIGLNHVNRAVETQLITFSPGVPTEGTWTLGFSANGGEHATFAFDAAAASIQSSLRGITALTDVWGTNLTVAGDYVSGFTVMASKYGNLSSLYLNQSGLIRATSMSGYAQGALSSGGWSNSGGIAGAPNDDNAYESISVSNTGTALIANMPTEFAGLPTGLTVRGLILTAFISGGGNIYDEVISFSSPYSPIGANLKDIGTPWNGIVGGFRQYGGSSYLWEISKDPTQWKEFLGNPTGGIYIQVKNTDTEYNQTAYIDALYLTVYYDIAITANLETTIDGYTG